VVYGTKGSLCELSLFYALHPVQIQTYLPTAGGEKQLLDRSKDVFGSSEREQKHYESKVKELHAKNRSIDPGSLGEYGFLGKAFCS